MSPLTVVAGLLLQDSAYGSAGMPASAMTVTYATIEVSPNREHVLIGQEVTFYLNATSDVTGSTLTYTLYYDYYLADGSVNPSSPVEVLTSENPGAVVTYFTYYSVGNCTTVPIASSDPYYVVRLDIDDGVSSPMVKWLIIWVYDNTAPYFLDTLPATASIDWGEEVALSFIAADHDDDPLDVAWDFGDGTPEAVNSSDHSATGVAFTQVHAWTPVLDAGLGGDYHLTYNVNITITDGQGNYLNASMIVDLYVPYNLSPEGYIAVDRTMVDPTDEINIYASAWDFEGDPITWTFTVTNDTEVVGMMVYHTPQSEPNTTTWNNITYVFGAIGNYTIRVYLSDAIDPALQEGAHNVSYPVSGIRCVNNSLPYVLARIMVTPETPWLNETTWTKDVLFYLEIADEDGDPVTLEWNFGDGSPTVTNTTASGALTKCYQMHTYEDAGMFNVTAVATDGREGHEVLRWRFVNVSSNNSAPSIMAFNITHTNQSFSMPNASVGFMIVFQDVEGDPINVTIEFGDGTPAITFYLDEFNETGCSAVTFNHTYATVGDYTLWINFTDNKFGTSSHNQTWEGLVIIDIEVPDPPRIWNVWDYVGLLMLFGTVGLFIAWGYIGVRKRKELDRMGLTWEEYNLRKDDEDFDMAGGAKERGGGSA